MIIVVDIAFSAILIVIGYIAVCYYLNNVKWNTIHFFALKPNRNKMLYLLVGVAACVGLIIMFQLFYHLSLIAQMKLLCLILIILPAAAVDYKIQKIPNQFILMAFILRCFFYIPECLLSSQSVILILKDNLLGAVVIGAFFLLLALVFKNSIGMGDIKLFAIMGLFQGLWGVVNSVFFSLLVSFFLSLFLLISKKKGRKDTIPFGPSIFLGTVIAIGLAGM